MARKQTLQKFCLTAFLSFPLLFWVLSILHLPKIHTENRASESRKALYDVMQMAPPKKSELRLNSIAIKPHYMTIYRPQGRTGNQIFQYAMLVSTARRYGYKPFVAPDFPLRHYFVIQNVLNISLENNATLGEEGRGIYNGQAENLDISKNWTLHGFFQSWKYHDENVLREELKFLPELFSAAEAFMNDVKIGSNDVISSVCLHVRRGDFFKEKYSKAGFAVADMDYINRAMDYFRQKIKNKIKFVVLSNDMDWCKENIKGSDVTYSTFTNPGEDLALMSLCDHVIVTSGTFGWWGGWFAGGEVVYFKGYPTPGSLLGLKVNATDYYPPHWIGMW